jgi:hypothetical protein
VSSVADPGFGIQNPRSSAILTPGSGIRRPDPGFGMINNPYPGSGMNDPDLIFENLVSDFFVKNT